MTAPTFLTECPISGDTDLRPLEGYESHHLVRSGSIGFVFCRKVPSADELQRAYDGYERAGELPPLTVANIEALLTSLEKYRRTGRMLDVGCGSGHILMLAKRHGWDVYGSEISSEAVELCRSMGIKMTAGTLVPSDLPPESFDIVIMTEVIEHINNPCDVISGLHRLLRVGGVLYFTTPNFNALERFLLRDKYGMITYPEHLSYYTPRVIDILFSKMGFAKEYLHAHGISVFRLMQYWQRYRGSHSSAPAAGPRAEAASESVRTLVRGNPLFRGTYAIANEVLSFLGVGNSIRGLYRKRAGEPA